MQDEPGDSSTADSQAAPSTWRSRPLLHYKDLGLSTQHRKIKFTCVHASETFVACGANNGSVYLYATSSKGADSDKWESSKYRLVKMISPPGNDRVGVTCVSICPMQKHLVVGNMRGIVYGIQLADYSKIGDKVEFTHDFHAGFPITCFLWDKPGLRLFAACNGGCVSQTVLRAGMSALFGSTDTELLLKEETGIVQLDLVKQGRSDILLVSSQLRVLLLNLTSSDGSAVQIGTKARQGNYGACFFTSINPDSIDPAKVQETKVFSARPGRRVWIADSQSGTVSSTLKFSLTKNPTGFLQTPNCELEQGIQPRDLTINKLGRFQFIPEPSFLERNTETSLLASWNVGSSVLFFLDPFAVEIVEWHLDLGIIHDAKIIHDNILVVLHSEPPKVSIVQSCSARQFMEIYGLDDVQKSVELAIEYQIIDASVLEPLHSRWTKLRDPNSASSPEIDKLSADLESLLEYAKSLEDQFNSSDELVMDDQPLQIIFKQRPQQQQKVSAMADMFSGDSKVQTPGSTGAAARSQVEYFDAVAPVSEEYSKSIYALDGSVIEARLISIAELSREESVVREDYRESLMEDLMQEVKQFEESRSEESAMGNFIPAKLKEGLNSSAAARAFSTFLPNASTFSNLMDPSVLSHHLGVSQVSSMFGVTPDEDDEIVLDPDYRLMMGGSMKDSNHCPVLRIAMSSTSAGEDDETVLDAEVLLEAISMDIYDSNLKYTSNLPLKEQLNLPDEDDMHTQIQPPPGIKPRRSAKRAAMSQRVESIAVDVKRDPSQTKLAVIDELVVDTSSDKLTRAGDNHISILGANLERQSSASPDAGRAAHRALQKYMGSAPSCEIKRKCMVGGYMATSSELDSILKREVVDLMAELKSAAMTAEQTKKLTRRLWPASGITRVCACLTNLLLFQGNFAKVESTIKLWLACFDPSARVDEEDNGAKSPDPANRNHISGFARGEALVDGDGLPLTRSDWNLVRTMISIYFAICAGGSSLCAGSAPTTANSQHDSGSEFHKTYVHEMGVVLEFNQRIDWSDNETFEKDIGADICIWVANEAEDFLNKYGSYLNPELAAEVCILRQFPDALKIIMDQVVSTMNMSETCNDITNWIAQKEISKALEALEESGSLCLFLHLLDLLLKECPRETIDLCAAKYPIIYPWNIERSLFGTMDLTKLHDENEQVSKPEIIAQKSKYLHYLVRLLEVKGDEAGKDAEIVNNCLQLCFSGGKIVNDLFDEDNRPGMGNWIASLIRQPDRFAFDHAKCWTLFMKNRLLIGLLELTLHSLQKKNTFDQGLEELKQLVRIIVEKKECSILENLFQRLSGLDGDLEDIVCSVLTQIQASMGKESRYDALISTVIYALLNSVGLQYGLKLLARFPQLYARTPLSMYHTIVETHVLNERQNIEVNQMVEVVDTNVWSSYKDASSAMGISFAPQVAGTLELELGILRPALDEHNYEIWEAKCKQYEDEIRVHHEHSGVCQPYAIGQSERSQDFTGPVSLNSSLTSRSFEYRNSDWGGEVQLHDSTCAVCELPVVIIDDDNCNLEVVLLPCGHAFHVLCMTDPSCSICLVEGLETLGWK